VTSDFLDQLFLEQAPYRAVKRLGHQSHTGLRLLGDSAHDSVAMKVLADQSEKNLKGCEGQRA
jgi:hypothetical protein